MEQVLCPHCGKRLFDTSPDLRGKIVTKCPRCKAAVAIDRKASEPTNQRQPSAK